MELRNNGMMGPENEIYAFLVPIVPEFQYFIIPNPTYDRAINVWIPKDN